MLEYFKSYIPFYRRNLAVAIPVVLSQAGQMTVQLADNMMVGHVGTSELAAASFANSIYIVALTAFLMGLRPNKAIFDASIMIWFWVGTVLPLLGLFLLSFTQGDVSLYGNWWERASQDGLAATAGMYDETMVRQGYVGMLAISGFLLFASAVL